MSVEALNCQCCGAPLKIESSTCKCDYCGSINIIGGDIGKYIDQLNRANKLRQQCEFDQAYSIYDDILSENIPSVDVLWSQALCEYGIEYVPDPVSGRYFPTLHRIKDINFLNYRNYTEALELADEEQKKQLKKEAEEIARIQEEYLNTASNEKPYDAFICYKETDSETGDITEDTALAEELYNELKGRGYKVFFAKETLKEKLSIDYEPYIFAALKSAKVMAVIGTKSECFTAVWVKNEWGRFLKLMDENPEKRIFFACKDTEDLPRAFANRQAQLLNDNRAIKNLAANIVTYLNNTSLKKAKDLKPLLTQDEYDRIISEKTQDYTNSLYKTKYGNKESDLSHDLSEFVSSARGTNKLYIFSYHAGAIMLLLFGLLHIIYPFFMKYHYSESISSPLGLFIIFINLIFFGGTVTLFSSLFFFTLFNLNNTKTSPQTVMSLIESVILLTGIFFIQQFIFFALFPVIDIMLLCAAVTFIFLKGFVRWIDPCYSINKKAFGKAQSKYKTIEKLEELSKEEFFEFDKGELEYLKQNYIRSEAEVKDYHYNEVEALVSEKSKAHTQTIQKIESYNLNTKKQIRTRNIFTIIYGSSAILLTVINILILFLLGYI